MQLWIKPTQNALIHNWKVYLGISFLHVLFFSCFFFCNILVQLYNIYKYVTMVTLSHGICLSPNEQNYRIKQIWPDQTQGSNRQVLCKRWLQVFFFCSQAKQTISSGTRAKRNIPSRVTEQHWLLVVTHCFNHRTRTWKPSLGSPTNWHLCFNRATCCK